MKKTVTISYSVRYEQEVELDLPEETSVNEEYYYPGESEFLEIYKANQRVIENLDVPQGNLASYLPQTFQIDSIYIPT